MSKIRYTDILQDIDIIINALESWRDPEAMLTDCKKFGVVNKPNQSFRSDSQTMQVIKEQLYDLLYHYEWLGTDKRYFEIIDERIKMFYDMYNEYAEERVDELRKEGRLCPKCEKGALNDFKTGKIKIYYTWTANTSSGDGYSIYKIYYKKCNKCDYWKIYKYKRIPLNIIAEVEKWFSNKYEWKDGDILEMYRNGKISGDRYKSYEVLEW